MKTLNEHNMDRRTSELSKFKAGVACDQCREELRYLDLNTMMMSMPPKMSVQCVNPECKDFQKIKCKVL